MKLSRLAWDAFVRAGAPWLGSNWPLAWRVWCRVGLALPGEQQADKSHPSVARCKDQ